MKRIPLLQGFTLLELTLVVVVIAILAGAALPIYVRTVARAKESEGWRFLGAMRAAELRYYTEYDETFTDDPLRLDLENAVSSPLFLYDITIGTTPPRTFTVCADPFLGGTCFGCRRLTLYNDGRTETGGPDRCP